MKISIINQDQSRPTHHTKGTTLMLSPGLLSIGSRQSRPDLQYPRQPSRLNSRGQYAASMPHSSNSRRVTVNGGSLAAPQHMDFHEPHVGCQPLQPAVPSLGRPPRLLRRDQSHSTSSTLEYPSNQVYTGSSIQDSRLMATSLSNTPPGYKRQPTNNSGSQRQSNVFYSGKLDSADGEYKIGHMSSSDPHDRSNSVSARAIVSSQIGGKQGAARLVTQNTAQNSRHEGIHHPNVQISANGQHGKDLLGKPKVATNGRAKGLIRFSWGQMEHREANETAWKPAVYHEELRDTLIAEASLLGAYDHPRERGIAANDVTSYLPFQKEWGPDRDRDWPKIKDNVLHRLERQNYPIPDYEPEIWYDAGRIVLDPDNHTILKYEIIPATLSSELSGRDMEAMRRLDSRITLKDFRVRMPSTVLAEDKGRLLVKKPLCTLSAIGMRTTRFRKENGMISWTSREGSDTIRQYILDHMPRANIDANSTQGMSLPTFFEQEDSRISNKGKYLNRAGGRALSDDVRMERARKAEEKLQKLHAAHIAVEQLTTHVCAKRGLEDDGMSEPREESRQTKQFGGNVLMQVTAHVCAKRRLEDDAVSEPQEESQQAKRFKGSVPLQVFQPNLNITSSIPLIPSPQVPSQRENQSPSVPPVAGKKRRREQTLSEDEENDEFPSERRHSQVVPSQLTTSSSDPSELPPRRFHPQRPRRSVREMGSGNRNLTSTGDLGELEDNLQQSTAVLPVPSQQRVPETEGEIFAKFINEEQCEK